MHQRAASTKQGFGVSRRTLLALAIVLAGQTWMRPAGAQEIEVLLPHKEAQVKCALLYSFSLMIGWPESAFADAKSPFVIGVLGDRPHLHYLDRVVATKKEIRGRPLVIERFGNVAEIRDCHILFVTGGVPLDVERAAHQRLAKTATLIVGERSIDTVAARSHIHFVIESQVVKFHLDIEAAKARQLQVDPRLLKLARSFPAGKQP